MKRFRLQMGRNSFKNIVDLAKPKENAKFVSFQCADGYTTSLTLEELLKDNVLLAYKLDGKFLEESLGAPLRLVVPDKYGYKSAMWLTRIKFTSKKELGYWESRGYSDSADVWKIATIGERMVFKVYVDLPKWRKRLV
ncbi:MAG: molybdopterin-dependent oxidoreductase [Candidatus Bathyarchaeota archaeon]|nr:molybdopterin-dependent oxidoreductase [Candidatus Bathyarchaeota archaeon]